MLLLDEDSEEIGFDVSMSSFWSFFMIYAKLLVFFFYPFSTCLTSLFIFFNSFFSELKYETGDLELSEKLFSKEFYGEGSYFRPGLVFSR